jgi:hypothetical protein
MKPNEEMFYLALETVKSLAKKVGGQNHGFAAIMLPVNFFIYPQINLQMTEALKLKNQSYKG